MYNIVPSLVDNNVLILPGAVSTSVDDNSYFFSVGSWLINLPTMVSLNDWRESFYIKILVLTNAHQSCSIQSY